MKLKANIAVKQCRDHLDILSESPAEDSVVKNKLSMLCDKSYQEKWKEDATL